MKQQIIIIFFSIILVFLVGNSNLSLEANPDKVFRYVQNEAFGLGEKLDYKVGYKFITAGSGTFEVMPKPLNYNGRKCYDIRFNVRSLESLEWIYKVVNRYRTIVDIDGLFPWAFEQHQREGNYKNDFKAYFDQINNKAYTGKDTFDIPDDVHDIVSAFFYVRTMNLKKMKKGDTEYLKNFYKDSTYSLGIKHHGRQRIEVEAGTFDCVVVEPLVVKGGLFKNEGNIFIWLSDDDRKIPVKVATKIVIGFVGAELTGYSGLRGPLAARVK